MNSIVSPSRAATETLFRFLHIKDVQFNPSTSGQPKAYLQHPDLAGSALLGGLSSNQNPASLRVALAAAIEDFSPQTSYKDFRTTHSDHLELLKQVREGGDLATLQTYADGLTAKSAAEVLVIWDNLIYQVVKDESAKIRNLALDVLKASALKNAFDGAAQGDALGQSLVDELSMARLEIPALIAEVFRTDPSEQASTKRLEGDEHLENALYFELYQKRKARLSAAVQELEAVEANQRWNYTPATFDEGGDPAGSSPPVNAYLSECSVETSSLVQLIREDKAVPLGEALRILNSWLNQAVDEGMGHVPQGKRTVVYNGHPVNADASIPDGRLLAKALPVHKKSQEYSLWLAYQSEDASRVPQALNIFKDGAPLEPPLVFSEVEKGTYVGELRSESLVQEMYGASELELRVAGSDGQGENAIVFQVNELMEGDRSFWRVSEPFFGDGEPGNPFVQLYGVRKIGVGEFKRVEQKICCYVEGEVSHIENIMAREYKERNSRSLLQTETTFEETEEQEVERQTDSSTTDRYEMQAEAMKVLDEHKNTNYGASASVQSEKFGVSVLATGFYNSTSSSSSSTSFSESESFAREVTERSVERILQRVSRKRTSRVLEEFENSNRHGFDNRAGDEHVVGIYRWVDKIYENKLVNYGKRLMYEFMIPEPAKFFRKSLETASADPGVMVLDEPVAPAQVGLNSPGDVLRSNYGKLAALYGATLASPPDAEVVVGKAMAQNTGNTAYVDVDGLLKDAYHYEVDIPEGYECYSARIKSGVTLHGANRDLHTILFVGGLQVNMDHTNQPNTNTLQTVGIYPATEKALPISVRANDAVAFNIHAQAYCRLKQDVMVNWQQESYAALIQAYQRRLAEYREALNKYNSGPEDAEWKNHSFSSQMHRTIEMRELKRLAIQLIVEPFGINLNQSHYILSNTQPPQLYARSAFANQARFVRFLEKAFDWEIMAYIFHPYFYADRSEWLKLVRTQSGNDFVFQSFLQSGMAEMTLPVRPGFEQAVMFLLDTGLLLNGTGFVLEKDDDLYHDLLEALEMGEPTVEATWHSRIPTALTIVQSNAAALQADGLPCWCEDGTPIATGESLLQGLEEGSGTTTDPVDPDPNPDCIEFNAQVAGIQVAYDDVLSEYHAGNVNCQDTIVGLQGQLDQLAIVLQDGQTAGCDTQVGTSLQGTISGQLTTIQQNCN